jgi:hypothetical protein
MPMIDVYATGGTFTDKHQLAHELYESDEAQALGPAPTAEGLLPLVDRVIEFARAGVNQATSKRNGSRA